MHHMNLNHAPPSPQAPLALSAFSSASTADRRASLADRALIPLLRDTYRTYLYYAPPPSRRPLTALSAPPPGRSAWPTGRRRGRRRRRRRAASRWHGGGRHPARPPACGPVRGAEANMAMNLPGLRTLSVAEESRGLQQLPLHEPRSGCRTCRLSSPYVHTSPNGAPIALWVRLGPYASCMNTRTPTPTSSPHVFLSATCVIAIPTLCPILPQTAQTPVTAVHLPAHPRP